MWICHVTQYSSRNQWDLVTRKCVCPFDFWFHLVLPSGSQNMIFYINFVEDTWSVLLYMCMEYNNLINESHCYVEFSLYLIRNLYDQFTLVYRKYVWHLFLDYTVVQDQDILQFVTNLSQWCLSRFQIYHQWYQCLDFLLWQKQLKKHRVCSGPWFQMVHLACQGRHAVRSVGCLIIWHQSGSNKWYMLVPSLLSPINWVPRSQEWWCPHLGWVSYHSDQSDSPQANLVKMVLTGCRRACVLGDSI